MLSGGANFTGTGQFMFALATSTNLNSPASAAATASGGFVTIINVTEGGSGYARAPTVSIIGGEALEKALALAISKSNLRAMSEFTSDYRPGTLL